MKIIKRRLKVIFLKYKKLYVNRFLKYSYFDLVEALKKLGIKKGDSIMIHSSFSFFNGYQGTPQSIIKAFKEVIGPSGNLLMVSLPYTTSTLQYLKSIRTFDKNKSISKMGIISEIFRRSKDVYRSASPTHPILCYGPLAEWFTENHENCEYPCGPGSPFEKLLKINGKVLFFDTTFDTFTYFHFIEDLIQDKLNYKLYESEVCKIDVIISEDISIKSEVYAFSKQAILNRKPLILKDALKNQNKLISRKIGNTKLMFVDLNEATSCAKKLADMNKFKS